MTRSSEAMAFIGGAATTETDACILWPFQWRTSTGYGLVRVRGGSGWTTTTAHRLVLTVAAGPPPTDRHQAAHDPHACGSPSCVNPRHLRWAAPVANMADQITQGTRGRPFLLPDQVRAIRTSADSNAALARRYGVSATAISYARRGITHAHIEPYDRNWSTTDERRP